MKTEELIHALAQDAAVTEPPPRRVLAVALVTGAILAAIVFAMLLGPRPDIAEASHQLRFLFKFVVTGALAAAAIALAVQMNGPVEHGRDRMRLLFVPLALIVVALLAELASIPRDMWVTRLVGTNWKLCMVAIPTIAAAPLVAMILALRHGAPSHPGLAGAAAGLVAGAIAATLYAAHCPDDSPLFVAVWYSIAIGIVTVAGALAGHRLLRW